MTRGGDSDSSDLILACMDGEIAGAVNLRDLGGRLAGDARVRRGLLFRSGITHLISAEGLQRLRSRHGVRRVVDLRSHKELERDGVARFAEHGIEFHHLAVYGTTALTPDMEQQRYRQMLRREYDWSERYKVLVSSHPESFAEFFRRIAAPGSLPAIFHCSAGRDRTGIAAAFVLEVLGVARAEIAEDYAVTGRHLRPHVHRYTRIKDQMAFSDEDLATALDTVPEHMQRFLDWMEATHGGVERFLLASGLRADELQALREALLERSS
jgi:protein-tyrosine phosphatase